MSRDGISPRDLLAIGREELRQYPEVEYRAGRVVDAKRLDHGFEVLLSDGGSYICRKLLLATGVQDVMPALPGVEAYWGRSVLVCPICDAWELRDAPLAAYGTGTPAKDLALALLAWTRDVILCTNGPSGLAPAELQHLKRHGIRVEDRTILRLAGKAPYLERIEFEGGAVEMRRAIFLSTPQFQRSPLAERLGCTLDFEHLVKGDYLQRTGVPGVFVAGNASEGLQLAIIAAAEGAKAGYAIHEELLDEELAEDAR